jgi:hypothetical protein
LDKLSKEDKSTTLVVVVYRLGLFANRVRPRIRDAQLATADRRQKLNVAMVIQDGLKGALTDLRSVSKSIYRLY